MKLDILFISDYVCPYCIVEKEAMLRALERTGIEADITWQPFELTMEPKPRVDTYNDEVRKAHYQVLVEPCKQMGLDVKLPPAVVPRPYTRLAFEGWYFACDHGKGDEYNSAVYRAYFMDEKDIGEIAVLAEIAEAVGLDKACFVKSLEDGVYSEKEHAAVMYAREELKPTGVPTIYIDGEKISIEYFNVKEMVEILKYYAAKKKKGSGFGLLEVVPDEEEEAPSFSGCGPDGC